MHRVSTTRVAVLPQFDTIGGRALVFRRTVVAILALRALESDSDTHLEASSTSTFKKSLLDCITGAERLSIPTP